MNALQTLLTQAKEKISDASNWTQEAFADNNEGIPVHASHDTACRWCALGALQHASAKLGLAADPIHNAARQLLNQSAKLLTDGVQTIVSVNDELGHAAVMKVYDAAIAAAGALHND